VVKMDNSRIDPISALAALRSYRKLRRRLDKLGDTPSLEQLHHINELSQALSGSLDYKLPEVSLESSISYQTAIGLKIDDVVTSLEGFFDWLKGSKAKKKEKDTDHEPAISQEEQKRALAKIKKASSNYTPVTIDGIYARVLLAKSGEVTEADALCDLLEKDLVVLKKAFSDYNRELKAWLKWANSMVRPIEKIVEKAGGNAEPDYDAIKEHLIKTNRSRVKRPSETGFDIQKRPFLLKTHDSESKDKAVIKIDPIKSEKTIQRLAIVLEEYFDLWLEIDKAMGDGLPGGDDYPFRDDEIWDLIEAHGSPFDWEGHTESDEREPLYWMEKLVETRQDAIYRWLDRGLKDE